MIRKRRQCTVREFVDIRRAMEITREEAASLGLPPNQILLMQLVTEEACTNAYEYGSNEREKPIVVSWSIRDGYFVITVRQTGSVFHIEMDKEIKQGIRGRGLLLITRLMDGVKLFSKGQYVYLRMIKIINEQ
jgi:serine/threonine-protein kinase RsbW